tara:strand:+ start:1670 stop:1948 length:279 start_codon:yes stop_codon:yes gene_type:complete
MSVCQADVSVAIVNNTRFEFDLGADTKPYFANEITLAPQEFGNILSKDKFRLGMRYKYGDHLKLDPHIFLQTQREDGWKLDYGSTVRLDLTF